MLPSSYNSQQTTVQVSLSSLYDVISEVSGIFSNNACTTKYDITNQIPLWVVYEKEQRIKDGIDGTNIFDFIQKYYDWLYCDDTNGAQYELGRRLLDNVDIEKTRTKFLERLASIYAVGFDNQALVQNGGLVEEQALRNFVKNIRRAFYHKKTTEDGIKYFFQTLFGVNEEDIQIQVPKQYILRLNGGKFYDENFKFPGSSASSYENTNYLSSYLNGSRLQDGNWIQDWSYLLKVGVPAYYYRNSYIDIAHPAGIKVVFEKTLADYRGPTFDDTVPTICDSAFLRNYAAYKVSFDYSGFTSGITYANSAYWGNIAGLTLIGLPRSVGCCGASFAGFTGQTYLFPNWSDSADPTKTNFIDINISTMFELCYPQLLVAGSPNSGFTGCP